MANNEQLFQTNAEPTATRKSSTNKRITSNYVKQYNSAFSTSKTSTINSRRKNHQCTTPIYNENNCCRRHHSVAYFSAHIANFTVTLHGLIIVLCLSPLTPVFARSSSGQRLAKAAVAAAPPVAAPLLANAASTLSLLNSTTQILSAYERNSLETNFVTKPAPALEQNRALKRVLLANTSVVCNDGSRAGFYLRKNPNSKKWIVFLEGGWHCYDTRTCRTRWLRLRHLMTSAQWPETRGVGGILSPMPEENPYWHNANHVLVPYCSSDSWSGTRGNIDETAKWRFMGALIIRQVIAELIPLGLGRMAGAELLLVGSSAGGLGVMLNLDHIKHYLLHERNLMVTVRGVCDSGWFIDREPYTPATVATSEAVRQGWKLWQGSLPEECTVQYPKEPWRCYFGYRLYPTLKAPLFVFQWLFDEAQMRADNVGAPMTPHQWNYIHEMGGALRLSLENVTAVFAPSCIGHAVLSKRDWAKIKIDAISLPSALRCWEHSTRQRRRRHNDKDQTDVTLLRERKRHQQSQTQKHRNAPPRKETKENNIEPRNGLKKRLTKAEREERRRLRHEGQQGRLRKGHQNSNNRHRNRHERRRNQSDKRNNNLPPGEAGSSAHERRPNEEHRPPKHNKNAAGHKQRTAHKRRRKEQRQQQLKVPHPDELGRQPQREQTTADGPPQLPLPKNHANNAGNRRNRLPRVPEKCTLRLMERCSWPQCNHSCPMLTNPLTGEEMNLLELLTSFGLDIDAVAAALGVDMHTLKNMDRTELVNLLTQQAS